MSLSVGKQIKLCGIEINHNKKLIGHSDADVGLHSLTDALLGALGSKVILEEMVFSN